MKSSMLMAFLVVSVLHCCVEASRKGKLTGKQRANIKLFKKLKKQSQKIANQIAKLKKDIAAAEKLAEASSRYSLDLLSCLLIFGISKIIFL